MSEGVHRAIAGQTDRELSTDFWSSADLVAAYSAGDLRPVETMLLDRHRSALSGRLLEIGCGAGRITRHLCALATEVHAIDISQAMVSHCRATCPEAIVVRRDLRDLSAYESGSFDALLAPFNVLDVLDHDDRGRALEGFARVVAPGGVLIMSSHNRAFAPSVLGPGRQLLAHLRERRLRSVGGGIVHLPKRVANHRRLRRFERDAPGYEIVNDSAHNYSILHYYISRDDQGRQLDEHGFELVECLDLEAEPVEDGEQAAGSPELHYVARRRE